MQYTRVIPPFRHKVRTPPVLQAGCSVTRSYSPFYASLCNMWDTAGLLSYNQPMYPLFGNGSMFKDVQATGLKVRA